MDFTPPHPDLWAFAVGHYETPAVREACLALQDARGHDVTAVFFALWRGFNGSGVAQQEWRELLGWLMPWQTQAIAPLRAVRRRLKTDFPAWPEASRETLRKAILAAELAGERAALERLGALAFMPNATAGAATARDNLHGYAAVAQLTPEQDRYEALCTHISAKIASISKANGQQTA